MEEVLEFTANYSWLFNFKVTDFFVDRVWDRAPSEWLDVFKSWSFADLTEVPYGYQKDDWPESLKEFISTCLRHSVSREINPSKINSLFENSVVKETQTTLSDVNLLEGLPPSGVDSDDLCGQDENCGRSVPPKEIESTSNCSRDTNSNLGDDFHSSVCVKPVDEKLKECMDTSIRRGMTDKKFHEVCNMASLIDSVACRSGAQCVIDVGSGLGYLGQMLHDVYGYRVLGLEGKQSHTSGAEKRAVKKSFCLQNRTCELHQNSESETHFQQVLSDWFTNLPPEDSHCCSCKIGSQPIKTYHVRQRDTEGDLREPSVLFTDKVRGAKSCQQCSCEKKEQLLTNVKPDSIRLEKDYVCPCQKGSESYNLCTAFSEQNDIHSNSCVGQKKPFSNGHCDMIPNQLNSPSIKCKQMENDSSPNISDQTDMLTHQTEATRAPVITSSICMVGLHCCGDLTPTMLKYFTKMDFIKSLCIVSCCYHRMQFDEDQSKCANFPLSLHLQTCLTKLQSQCPEFHFTQYSLRLAAQETRARWKQQTSEDHAYHTRNVAYRGILELCLSTGEFKMKKTSRKIVHKKDCTTFDDYVRTVSKHIHAPSLDSEEGHLSSFWDKMQNLYNEYEPFFVYIEPITALQFLLQPVLETLIYNDREYWLKEQGQKVRIIPVFDEIISPRNLALVAVKP